MNKHSSVTVKYAIETKKGTFITANEWICPLRDALDGCLQSAEDERGRLVAAVMSTVGG